MNVPFLGKIPIDPKISEEADKGIPFVVGHMNSPAAKAFKEIVKRVENFLTKRTRASSLDYMLQAN